MIKVKATGWWSQSIEEGMSKWKYCFPSKLWRSFLLCILSGVAEPSHCFFSLEERSCLVDCVFSLTAVHVWKYIIWALSELCQHLELSLVHRKQSATGGRHRPSHSNAGVCAMVLSVILCSVTSCHAFYPFFLLVQCLIVLVYETFFSVLLDDRRQMPTLYISQYTANWWRHFLNWISLFIHYDLHCWNPVCP